MDEIEANLRGRLIAARELKPELATQLENQLYEYQLKIGSAAAYFTYERNNAIGDILEVSNFGLKSFQGK